MDDLHATSETLAGNARRLISDICGVAWTRLPGSKGERDAQAFMKDIFSKTGADAVEVQDFKLHARFFRWWPVISIVFFWASIVLYLVSPLLALIAAILAFLNLGMKILSFDFLDVLFKNEPSSNVIGKLVLPGGKQPDKLVIVGGHIDSNYEYPIGSKLGTKLVYVFIFAAVVMVLMLAGIAGKLAFHVAGGLPVIDTGAGMLQPFVSPAWFDVPFYIVLVLSPLLSYVGIRMVSSNPVPGANDNLSGIGVTVALLDHFHRKEHRPVNTEIWFVSFGSEEGGMKGSKHMSKTVQDALRSGKGDLPASTVWVVNFDSVASNGPMLIATKEPIYRCTYLPDVYTAMARSAEKAGVPHVVKALAAGSDSAPFGRRGIPATGIVGMGEDGHSPKNWHSLEDTPENMRMEGILHSIKLGIQFIADVDATTGNPRIR